MLACCLKISMKMPSIYLQAQSFTKYFDLLRTNPERSGASLGAIEVIFHAILLFDCQT